MSNWWFILADDQASKLAVRWVRDSQNVQTCRRALIQYFSLVRFSSPPVLLGAHVFFEVCVSGA